NERLDMTVDDGSANVMTNLRNVVEGAEDLLNATADQTAPKHSQARERLRTALESAKGACQRMQENAAAAAKTADRVIRDHPYESIGVAFGVGLLIGALIARK
ncbi:MAG: DUF883 family protein, partial [Verrucomicrobia bacterium]|nr:DUF883 family protein [Verrucomicrobiota bacterium]